MPQTSYFPRAGQPDSGPAPPLPIAPKPQGPIRPDPWPNVPPQVLSKLADIAIDDQTNPEFLKDAIEFETGGKISPAVRNGAGSGGVGYLQFTPSTARRWGLTTDDLARMTPERQLDYVARYLAPFKGRLNTFQDAYMAILDPKAVGKPPDYVLFDRTRSPRAYGQNPGLDRNNDGQITAGEAAAMAQQTPVQRRAANISDDGPSVDRRPELPPGPTAGLLSPQSWDQRPSAWSRTYDWMKRGAPPSGLLSAAGFPPSFRRRTGP